jgi:hypothetical protein
MSFLVVWLLCRASFIPFDILCSHLVSTFLFRLCCFFSVHLHTPLDDTFLSREKLLPATPAFYSLTPCPDDTSLHSTWSMHSFFLSFYDILFPFMEQSVHIHCCINSGPFWRPSGPITLANSTQLNLLQTSVHPSLVRVDFVIPFLLQGVLVQTLDYTLELSSMLPA